MTMKITLLATTIALVAFAVPTVAGASPQITYPVWTTLGPGSEITGTSTNFVTTTSLGNLKCAKVSLPGLLTKNTGTLVEDLGLGAGTTATCSIESEPINITDVTLSNLTISKSGSGMSTFSFKADLPVVGTCTYSGTNAPFTYTSGGSSIKFTSVTLVSSPSACGAARLDADFRLEKTSGGNVLILD